MTIADQAAEVQKVKRSQSGMISDPITLPPSATLADAEALMHQFKISGVPITDPNGRLVGILTNRDTRFCEPADFRRSVTDFMTSEGLVTAKVGTTLDEARSILQRHRIEKLPLVDAERRLVGLITVKDILKNQEFPNATSDSSGRLRCAAAVGVGDDLEERVEALYAQGVDAIAIDTAHGHSAGVIKAIERIKSSWPSLAVVAGNVVTPEGVEALSAAGAAVVTGLVNEYQLSRFTAFFNQNSNDPALRDFVYQGRNAIRALATGGVTGKGWLQGPITMARSDIPVQWADLPFSAVGEEFGLVGCAVVIGLYALVLLRIWRIAHLSRDLLGTYLCVGVFTMLLWQVFQNIAMTVGVMPITGLPLPFISYGGSGLVTFFALMGLVQNVHMRRYRSVSYTHLTLPTSDLV